MFSRRKLEKEIIEYGRLCGVKNFTPGYSGNISARYKEGLLITASGSSNGYLTPKNIVYDKIRRIYDQFKSISNLL